MESLAKETPAGWEPGRSSEIRRSPRRRTLTRVRLFEGSALGERLLATDLSADGAFLRSLRPVGSRGERLRLSLEIPTDPDPIEVAARIVRATPAGFGVRFEELSARDRARLRSYAGFYEMDEAIVRVQGALGDVIPGNLLRSSCAPGWTAAGHWRCASPTPARASRRRSPATSSSPSRRARGRASAWAWSPSATW